jgi:hypothetical protein
LSGGFSLEGSAVYILRIKVSVVLDTGLGCCGDCSSAYWM